jgi:hypothetical protein
MSAKSLFRRAVALVGLVALTVGVTALVADPLRRMSPHPS